METRITGIMGIFEKSLGIEEPWFIRSVRTENSNYISNKWIFEIKTVGPAGIVFFDDDGFNCYSPTIRDVLPGQSKTLSEIGMTVSVLTCCV